MSRAATRGAAWSSTSTRPRGSCSGRPTARAGGRAATGARWGRRSRSTATRWAGGWTPAAARPISGSRPTAWSGSATGSRRPCCSPSCSCCCCAARRRCATACRRSCPTPISVARMPVGRAALAALVVGAALGFVFAARSAPLIAAGTFLILWRGIGTRALVAAAGALLLGGRPAPHPRRPRPRSRGLQLRVRPRADRRPLGDGRRGGPADPRAGPNAQYGHGPSRSRATTSALIARLRANHGSSRELAQRVARPRAAPQRHPLVLGERARAARVAPARREHALGQQRERDADRGEGVVHEHRPARDHAPAPAGQVRPRRSVAVRAVDVQERHRVVDVGVGVH